jgi:hypothetical protein
MFDGLCCFCSLRSIADGSVFWQRVPSRDSLPECPTLCCPSVSLAPQFIPLP